MADSGGTFWAANFFASDFWAVEFWQRGKKHTVNFESSSRTIEFVGEPQRSTDFESSSRTIEFSST